MGVGGGRRGGGGVGGVDARAAGRERVLGVEGFQGWKGLGVHGIVAQGGGGVYGREPVLLMRLRGERWSSTPSARVRSGCEMASPAWLPAASPSGSEWAGTDGRDSNGREHMGGIRMGGNTHIYIYDLLVLHISHGREHMGG